MYLKYFLDTWIILELVVLTTCALKLKYKANLGVQIEFIKCMNAFYFMRCMPAPTRHGLRPRPPRPLFQPAAPSTKA